MTKTKKDEAEAAAEIEGKQEQKTQTEEEKPAPVGDTVYCGPSVRGVARQYTVYHGELPDEVKEFADKHKAAGALIVPIERFAETRKNLETKGTVETVLYEKIKKELREET